MNSTPTYYAQIAHDLRTPIASIGMIVEHLEDSENPTVRHAATTSADALTALREDVDRLDPNRHPVPDDSVEAVYYFEVVQALRKDLLTILQAFKATPNVQFKGSDLISKALPESARTVLELLDLADPQLRHARSIATTVSMESELRRIVRQSTPFDKDGPLKLHLAVNGDFNVPASPVMATRLFGNLIGNAMAAVRKTRTGKGWVRVTVRASSPASGEVWIEDNGTGIASADLDRIWDQSFTTSEGDGHGFGMGIVRDMVDRMGGSIDVVSTLGEGTRFTLTFSQPT